MFGFESSKRFHFAEIGFITQGMILVCPSCDSRYLVPATAFATGPRPVRCARCGHGWQASLPPIVQDALDQAAAGLDDAAGQFAAPPDAAAPLPAGSNLPALPQEAAPWRNPRFVGVVAGGLAVLLALLWLLLDRHAIAARMPWMGGLYRAVGLSVAQAEEGLVLRQVRSERRYEEGTMRLIVEGEVYNGAGASVDVPDIHASALGPDGKAMQSWKIDAPAARLAVGEAAPFRSAVTTPEGTVAEVNLSFVGTHHVQAE